MGKLVLTQSDISKANNVILNNDQIGFILASTPKKHIRKRPAKGGGTWQYVSINYVQKVLNMMFGWDWNFEIEKEEIFIEAGEVVVKGKLTVNITHEDKHGNQVVKTIIKSQYGNKDIQFLNENVVDKNGNIVYNDGKPKKQKTNKPLSIGNDLKSAASDALKKCASLIGIAQDVYAPQEFREIEIKESEPDVADLLSTCESKQAVHDIWKQLSESQQNKYHNLFKMLEL